MNARCLLLRCAILVPAVLQASATAQIRLAELSSTYAVVGIGDYDNDGSADFVLAKHWVAEVVSGKTRLVLARFAGGPYGTQTWPRVASADFDRDGHADVLIGWPWDRPQSTGSSDGVVRIYSGKTSQMLREHRALWEQDEFGWSVDVVGDVDQDGSPDYVVGAPSAPGGSGSHGVVTVHSGADGRMLYFDTGSSSVHKLGWSVARLGDVDRDGVPDYAASGQQRGLVRIYSGKTGTVMRESFRDTYSTIVAGTGDVDLDGHADWVVGYDGAAEVISGRTFTAIHVFRQTTPNDDYGRPVLGTGDLDGDGVPDVLVAATGRDVVVGNAKVYSGKTGAVIHTITGRATREEWGDLVAAAGDYNGDQVPDISFGASKQQQVYVVSGDGRPLRVDRTALSLGTGGTQNLHLEATPAQQRKLYLVLGSMTGTQPGIRIGNVVLPLVSDVYHVFTLTSPNTLIVGSLGILGSQGEATAAFVLPTGLPPSLAGTRLFHAYLAMNLLPFRVDFASNAVFVDLIK